MCTASVGNLLIYDERIQNLMNKPEMDIIHKQVVMTLYSLDLSKRLDEYEKLLPVYLGLKADVCREILVTIEKAGLIENKNGKISLKYPIISDQSGSCGCSH